MSGYPAVLIWWFINFNTVTCFFLSYIQSAFLPVMVIYWFGKRECGKFTNKIPVIGGPARPPMLPLLVRKLTRLNTLTKIANCMELPKNRALMNAVFYNKISLLLCYYLDVPLFQNCSLNNKINGLFKRCHRIIHNHKISKLEEILNKNNSLTTIKVYTHLLL